MCILMPKTLEISVADPDRGKRRYFTPVYKEIFSLLNILWSHIQNPTSAADEN